jgi:hypothetical protein
MVINEVGLLGIEDVMEGICVTEVDFIEGRGGVKIISLTGGEIIDDGDVMASGDEGVDDVRSDESGAAGD